MGRLHSGAGWSRLGANALDEELVGDPVLIFGGPTLWNAVQARCKSINEELKNELCVDMWWPHTMKRFHSGTMWFRLGANAFDEELVGDSVLISLWNTVQARCKSVNEELKNEHCVDVWWPHTMERFHSGTVWLSWEQMCLMKNR